MLLKSYSKKNFYFFFYFSYLKSNKVKNNIKKQLLQMFFGRKAGHTFDLVKSFIPRSWSNWQIRAGSPF